MLFKDARVSGQTTANKYLSPETLFNPYEMRRKPAENVFK